MPEREIEANAATDAGEWLRAAELWDALRHDLPQDARSWIKTGQAYCEAGMFEEADRVLDGALSRFPEDEWVAYWYIMVARRQLDWPEALSRAEEMRQLLPHFWRPWLEVANALDALERRAEAEELRREARRRFPDEFWPNFAVARLEAERSDSPGAVRIWSELAARFPTQPAVADALQTAREAARHPSRQRSPVAGDGLRRLEAPTRRPRGFPWLRRGRAR